MTRGKKKQPVKPPWQPFVCHGETMKPRYRKGKPGVFTCRHCGNVRPQRVKGRVSTGVYGKSVVESLIIPLQQENKRQRELMMSVAAARDGVLNAFR